jgi:hypothetical protein
LSSTSLLYLHRPSPNTREKAVMAGLFLYLAVSRLQVWGIRSNSGTWFLGRHAISALDVLVVLSSLVMALLYAPGLSRAARHVIGRCAITIARIMRSDR